ncbi:MAG: type I secretion system permease/ATPase [Rhodocyclaceae bacterium]|nr:type I secretion system permease/ATPase [Rhodocyclaceae bacterium]
MKSLLWSHRRLFFTVAAFSFFVNLLQLAPSFYWMAVFDRVITARSESTLLYLTLGVALTLLLVMALEILRSRLLVVITVLIDREVAPKIFDALVTQGGRPDRPPYPEGMRDIYTLRNYITGNGVFALFDAPWLPIYLIIIFLFSPVLGWFSLAGAVLLFVTGYINEKLSRDALDTMYREMAASSRFADTAARNAESVLALGMLPAIRKRWDGLNNHSLSHQVMTAHVIGSTVSLTRLVRQAVQIMMLCVGVWLILRTNASIGVMVASTFIASRALVPVEMLLSGWAPFAEARAAYRRLDAFLAAEPARDHEPMALAAPKGAVTAERLVFAVPGKPQPILKGVGFSVMPGECIGIIGPSGSGKSTLVRLLVGLWRPTAGAVRYDGADLLQWNRDDLGRHVGYVPQSIELFAGTVAENIARMGEVDADRVMEAAKKARVHDLIVHLPQGYETPVGEGGASLSGGQRQRIAIARAIYGEPRIVVLDEPNSNLDSEGEFMLQGALQDLKAAGATCLVVAHRPSILAQADRILVLRDGLVEAFGPRNEIVGRYVPGAVAAIAPLTPPGGVPPAGGTA